MRFVLSGLVALAYGVQLARGSITGSKVCNKYVCVTGLHDDTFKKDIYTLAPPAGQNIAREDFGWMAVGFGETMAHSPMVIVWPNGDGSFTLSQRQAPSNVRPSLVANPPRKATLDTASTFANTTSTSITFSLPSNSNATTSSLNKTVLIWAYSKTNPGSASTSANIVQHDAAGAFQMPLLASWGSSTTGKTTISGPTSTSTPTGNDSGDDKTTTTSRGASRKTLLAHAVCGGLATLVLLPAGVLIPRIARGFSTDRWWFPVHGAVNGVLAGLLVLITYGIARANFHQHGELADTPHRKLGLALFLLVLFQIGLGIFVHWFKSPFYTLQTESGRGPSNFLHMVLGTVIVILGWVTTWKGLAEEWPRWSSSGKTDIAYKILWGLVVAVTCITYLGGLIFFLPKQRALEREARMRHTGVAGPLKWEQDGQGVEMNSATQRIPEGGHGVYRETGGREEIGQDVVSPWNSSGDVKVGNIGARREWPDSSGRL